MMLKGLTVQYLIRQTYRVKSGDTILLHAAAGGVGLILGQWAKHLGATVIGTVGSDDKAKLAQAHGCAHTIVYTREDFVKRVDEITGARRCLSSMTPSARYLPEIARLPGAARVAALFGQSSAGRATQSRPAGAKRIALRHPPDAQHYAAKRENLVAMANELFDVVKFRRGQDRGPSDLSAEGRGQGACRSRCAQDHGIDGFDGLRHFDVEDI